MGSRAWGPAALLAACILTPRILGAEAVIWPKTDIPVMGEPPRPQTGDNLTLTPGGTPRGLRSCSWYRGPNIKKEKKIISSHFLLVPRRKEGHAFTGRETAGPNCTLHIWNLTILDAGNYTVEKKGLFHVEVGRVYVEVTGPPLSKLSPGIISGIIIGLLLAVTAGIGASLYFFVRGTKQGPQWSSPSPGPILAPAQSVSNLYQSVKTPAESTEAVPAYLVYEYLSSGQEECWVKCGISSDMNREYQALYVSREGQDVYHDLRTPTRSTPAPFSWPRCPS